MRRTTLLLASIGLLLGGGATVLFAGDPAPLPAADAARIQQLVEDLASADFRVREAAWKALVEYGEKARTALESAVRSENPAVRFRAEQLLARLNGGTQERPLDDGTTPAPTPAPKPGGGGLAPAGPGRFFTDEDFDRIMRETEERMRKMAEEMRREFGGAGPSFGPGWFGPGAQRWTPFLGGRAASRELRLDVDGASLRESPRGARLELKEKADNGTATTTVFEGKTFDAILEARPELKDEAAVKALIEKRTAELAARAAREKTQPANPPGGFASTGRSVMVSSQYGKTTVTITETGPDGKSTTKTYEGPDLETIRREHPEIADSIGGARIEVLPGGPGAGVRPLPPRTPDDPTPDDGWLSEPATGPFGLGLVLVDDVLASHLGLEAGHGAVVAIVREGSDAAKLGLQKNDVITAVNGTAVTSLEQVAELVRAAKDGALAIDVLRAGKPVTLKR